MNDLNNDDSLEVASKSWHRLIDAMSKAGYRDGIEKGSQAVLQTDFDKGYVDGFKISYILGKYKSLMEFALNDIEHPVEINEILKNTNKGLCYICDVESSNGDVEFDSEPIINHHREHVSKTLERLYLYFYPLLKDRGIDINNLKY